MELLQLIYNGAASYVSRQSIGETLLVARSKL